MKGPISINFVVRIWLDIFNYEKDAHYRTYYDGSSNSDADDVI